MAVRVRGAVALVTGAAAETGRAIALRLGAEGARVVVADVDARGGEETARMIGGEARFVAADMTSPEDIAGAVAFAERELGGLELLVNNAGGGGHVEPHFPDAAPAEWRAWLELNLAGPMLATQLALGPMQRAGGGAVVNVASTAGLGLGPHVSPEYAAAKAGLIRFTSTLAGLRERMDVRVNCVVPDWIETSRARAELAAMSAEERAAAPEPRPVREVAEAVVRLAGDTALAGRVLVMWPGDAPRLLGPE
jgi:NAD(P)-dependent dehydrogenase (short-subunit alcohol dehydrogenase family)